MKPPVFNYAEHLALQAELTHLRTELTSLAIETVNREKTVARLEAEVADMLEAIYKKQRDINNLQNQNMRLAKRLRIASCMVEIRRAEEMEERT